MSFNFRSKTILEPITKTKDGNTCFCISTPRNYLNFLLVYLSAYVFLDMRMKKFLLADKRIELYLSIYQFVAKPGSKAYYRSDSLNTNQMSPTSTILSFSTLSICNFLVTLCSHLRLGLCLDHELLHIAE